MRSGFLEISRIDDAIKSIHKAADDSVGKGLSHAPMLELRRERFGDASRRCLDGGEAYAKQIKELMLISFGTMVISKRCYFVSIQLVLKHPDGVDLQ